MTAQPNQASAVHGLKCADLVDPYEAIGDEPTGKVIVLASNGYTDTSMGGGTPPLRLHQNGCAGLLTDGRLRDFDELARYGFAAYCSGEATRWGGDGLRRLSQMFQ
jgi:regulator of RNase E activity RraA